MCNELGLMFGRCANYPKAILKEKGNDEPSSAQLKKATDKIEEEHHTIIFLYKTDRSRYGKLIKQTENDLLQHKDLLPKTVGDMCHILSGWQNIYGNNNTRITEANDGVAFETAGTEESKGNTTKEITCYKCKKTSHYSNECQGADETMNTSNKKSSSFFVLGYGTVWYHLEGITYITVCNKHKVTYGSSQGMGFVMHKVDGTCRVFTPSTKGLFFSDVKGDTAHVSINTVENSKSKYTVKQYSDAHKARLMFDIIGRPSMTDYIKYVENDLIPNCPITKEDIMHTEDILGPNLCILKVKNDMEDTGKSNT